MSRREFEQLPAVAELREQLRDAARREMVPAPARVRRWRRGGLVVAVAGLAAAGAAGAGALLSTGEPIEDLPGKSPLYASPGAGGRIAVVAADPVADARWGAAVYRGRDGSACVLAGQLEGQRLGVVRDGVFRPYARGTIGACGDPATTGMFLDLMHPKGDLDRTLVLGRARAGTDTVTISVHGERQTARTGHGGAFLFLFEGDLAIGDLRIVRD